MSCNARVKVTFVLDYEAGCWGEDCTIGQVRDQATREAQTVARQIIEAVAKHTKHRLSLLDVDRTFAVLTPVGKR
jgi:hypothetical protein